MFETSLMGSMPRTRELLSLAKSANKKEYQARLENETKSCLELQNELDFVVSGELARDNYLSFVASKLIGARLVSMSQLIEFVEDKRAFEGVLELLDVPSFAIKNAICDGKLALKSSLIADEIKLIKKFTQKNIKITLPGAYLLTRSMWLEALSTKAYEDKKELGADVVSILKTELETAKNEGVSVVQFDEPVLSEVVFAPQSTRTFMCAALSQKKDIKTELDFALSLIKPVFDHAKKLGIKVGLHVCRGNWSKDESILLSGSYAPMVELFEEIGADVLFLEFSTARAGEMQCLLSSKTLSKNTLALGVINPRIEKIESKDEIIKSAQKALKAFEPEHLWLSPDCGFATFANRPLNSTEIIKEKIASLNAARDELRQMYGRNF